MLVIRVWAIYECRRITLLCLLIGLIGSSLSTLVIGMRWYLTVQAHTPSCEFLIIASTGTELKYPNSSCYSRLYPDFTKDYQFLADIRVHYCKAYIISNQLQLIGFHRHLTVGYYYHDE
jgi:hypothetical protein